MLIGTHSGGLVSLSAADSAANVTAANTLLSKGVNYHNGLQLTDAISLSEALTTLTALNDIGFWVGIFPQTQILTNSGGTPVINTTSITRAASVGTWDTLCTNSLTDAGAFTTGQQRKLVFKEYWNRFPNVATTKVCWPRLYYGKVLDLLNGSEDYGYDPPHIVDVDINDPAVQVSDANLPPGRLASDLHRFNDRLKLRNSGHRLYGRLTLDDGITEAGATRFLRHVIYDCPFLDCLIIRCIDDPGTQNNVALSANIQAAILAVTG